MIYSDKQYKISSNVLAQLKGALVATKAQPANDERLQELKVAAITSQIVEVEADIARYDMLKSGKVTFAKSFSLDALPNVLIEARIASGMSQTDLAKKIGVQPQQIQRYEASNYMGANLTRLIKIAKVLKVQISGLFENETRGEGAVNLSEDSNTVDWSKFPAREMARRNWFDVPRGQDIVECAKAYFFEAVGSQFAVALHRKRTRGSNSANEYGLLAWQARVLERARVWEKDKNLLPFRLDDRWLPDLVQLTRHENGPKRAQQLLAEHGIVLVIERHFPRTYLDGATMLSENDRPVIGLTLRHDRLDNFWFVLFHELGHVFLHLFDGPHYGFFDDENTTTPDKIEIEADQFALNTLIPDELWDHCSLRFVGSDEAVQIDADKLNIAVSILAGRIRKERNDYTILNNLVGYNKVRCQFQEVNDVFE